MSKESLSKNKKNPKKDAAKQKTKRLFYSTFIPLMTITILSCTVFALLMIQIVTEYIKVETKRVTGEVSSNLTATFKPDELSVSNTADFAQAGLTIDVMDTLVNNFAKKLSYATMLYYATKKSRFEEGGGFVNSAGWVPPADLEPRTRPWFLSAADSPDKIVYCEPYIDAMSGKVCSTFAKAAVGSDGKVVGVAALDITLGDIQAYLETIFISENTKIYMLDSEGLYLTNDDPSKIANSKFNFFKESKSGFTKEDLFKEGTISIANRKYFAAASKIGDSPWYIVAEGPMSDYKTRLLRFVYIFEGVLVLMSFISAAANLRTIFKSREEDRKMGAALFEETQNLVVASKENAATSQDQSAAVKEIVATMEDSNSLSENISTKIKDVSKVAQTTSAEVTQGVTAVEKNVEQLHSIFDANQQTIKGMKDLGEKIDSIWDIVNLINSVADQAKIIAFNAEIEATSAGESGKKFRIVANEIRRLSDGIIDSTKEVKEKITEIQHSSDTLILASENGTEKINAGYETAKELSEHFDSIKSSSEITADSAKEITDIIQQQTAASEQILIALKQIAAGVENFTVATNNISSSADSIRSMAEELNTQNIQEAEQLERRRG